MRRGDNYQEMVAFFERHDLHFQTHPDAPVLMMQMTGENGVLSLMALCDDEAERFAVFCKAPIHAPEPKRILVAEYVTRANYGLMVGNFELDFSDGEVRFKIAMDTDGIRLNEDIIGLTIFGNCRTMDKYLPGLMSVIYGNSTPEQAIREVEKAAEDRETDADEENDEENQEDEGTNSTPSRDDIEATIRRLLS